MKKLVVFSMFAVAGFFCWSQAQADTWQTKWMVNKATTATLNPDDAVQDSNGNNWFHAYEANSPNAFAGSFIYEYKTDGTWVNHTDAVQSLLTTSLAGNQTLSVQEELGVNTIAADKSGNFWAAVAPCSLIKYDGTNWSYVSPTTVWEQVLGTSVTGINGGYFYNMFSDNQGNIYTVAAVSATGLGNEDSIRVIKRTASTGTWSTVIPKDDTIVNYAHQARLKGAYNNTSGDFWFYMNNWDGTAANGVYRYHNSAWTNYTTADGLISNDINNLMVDSSGNVWVVTDSGVSKWNGSSWTNWTTANSSLTSNYVERISEDSSGRIWFTSLHDTDHDTQGGAAIYDPAETTWSYYSSKNGDDDFEDITKVFFLGNDLWATAGFQQNGFTILSQNDTFGTLYGQVGGTLVEKAGLNAFKKAKTKTKKVTIYTLKQGKKHKVVYRGRTSSGWYKALNLRVGQKYRLKIQGKPLRTVRLTNGDPLRSNF